MSETLARIRTLVADGHVEVTRHASLELAEDEIRLDDIVAGVAAAAVVEDYPDAVRGPTVLALERDRDDNPIHVLWGIPRDERGPAVLITAYKPDPARWSPDFTMRRLR